LKLSPELEESLATKEAHVSFTGSELRRSGSTVRVPAVASTTVLGYCTVVPYSNTVRTSTSAFADRAARSGDRFDDSRAAVAKSSDFGHKQPT